MHRPVPAARALLRQLGVLGPDKELDEAIEWFHRHAYDLNLLGNYLAKCTTDHDIRAWQQKFPLLKEDERIHPLPNAAGKRAGHGSRMLTKRSCASFDSQVQQSRSRLGGGHWIYTFRWGMIRLGPLGRTAGKPFFEEDCTCPSLFFS